MLLLAIPAAAQPINNPAVASFEARTGLALTLPINKSQSLRVPRPFARIAIGNPKIADVTPVTESGPGGPFDGWPLRRGFDRFYGFLDAETDQFSPELVQDNTLINAPGSFDTGYHLTEDLIDQASRGDHP
jgi:hypothetical protein